VRALRSPRTPRVDFHKASGALRGSLEAMFTGQTKAKITTIPAKNHLVFWVKIRYGETENNRLGKGKPFCTVKQSACTAGALSVRRALSPF